MSLTTSTGNSSDTKDSTESKGTKLSIKSETEIVSYANGLFERARKSRLQFERQWYMNLAFYFGKQYVQWARGNATTLNRLYEPPAPSWRVRLVSNKIRPITRSELAKITKENPRAFVIPASSDDDDLAAARAGEAIFEHLWRTLVMRRNVRRTVFWMLMCGSSFIKDWWDAEQMQDGVPGSICAEPISPFHFWVPDLQEEVLEYQPYAIHGIAKTAEWVKHVYDKDVTANAHAAGDLLQQKFLQAIGIQELPKDYVAVKEAWIKPCNKFKDGAVITWSEDTLLELSEGWPYDHGEYPFTKIDHIPTGRFYAESTLVDLIPLQKEYNRTRSQIIEAKNRMSKPQLTAQRGSIDPSKITSEPGLVILYTPGFQPPQPIPLSSLPQYVIEEQNRIQSDMNDISSQHEITKGQTPPGVTAATAISYLQEQDDSKIAPTIASLEEGIERVGRHFLAYVQQYWEEERAVRVVGTDGAYDTHMFTAASIKGNCDLKVEAGSAMPQSRSAKQAFITELGKMGWIPPQRALRYLDMAETGRLYEEMQIDSRQAQRENLRMAKTQFQPAQPPPIPQHDPLSGLMQPDVGGLPPELEQLAGLMQTVPPAQGAGTAQVISAALKGGLGGNGGTPGMDQMLAQQGPPQMVPSDQVSVNTWDNHMVHIEEHNTFRKKQEFERLSPEIKQIFEQHVAMHQQVLMSQQQAAMQQQAQATGGAPGSSALAAPPGVPPVPGMGGPPGGPPGAG